MASNHNVAAAERAVVFVLVASVVISGDVRASSTYRWDDQLASTRHFGSTSGEIESYCESDVIEIDCQPTQVIVIKHAHYGRMRENRCISNAYGEIGCYIDVIDRLDAACSGRRHCDVIVAGLAKEKHQACPKDFRSYLEMSYECVTVAFADEAMCRRRPGPVELRGETRGFLSNLVAQETGCGSFDSPWWLAVEPSRGQRLRLTMYEFAPAADGGGRTAAAAGSQLGGIERSDSTNGAVCRVYAVVKEIGGSMSSGSGSGISETICRDAANRRGRVVYTSGSSGLIEIRLANATVNDVVASRRISGPASSSGTGSSKFNETAPELTRTDYFIIAFDVIGCPDLEAPPNGWIRRSGDEALVGCNLPSGVTWRMECDGSKWRGEEKRNCTPASSDVSDVSWMLSFSHSKVTSLTLMAGIAVIVGIIILMFGLVYLHSRMKRGTQGQDIQADNGGSSTCSRLHHPSSSSGVTRGPRTAAADDRYPTYESDASDILRKQMDEKPYDPNNHYSVSNSHVTDYSASDDDVEGCGGAGRRLVLTSSGVGRNDYFHALIATGPTRGVRTGPLGSACPSFSAGHRLMMPCQQQQQCGSGSIKPTCCSPRHQPFASTYPRPSDLGLGDCDPSTPVEHIYESPNLDSIPAEMTSLMPVVGRYSDAHTVDNAEKSDYFSLGQNMRR